MINILEDYQKNPPVSFKDQEEGETILLLLRRHTITNLLWFSASVFLFAVPIIFLLSPYKSIFTFLENIPFRYIAFIIVAWYQLVISFVLTSFAAWFYNLDLVTTKRIFDVDYWGFLYFNVAETPLENIQDVTYSISGLSQTLFNFGNVNIQTAGKEANFEFSQVPEPATVHDLVIDLMEESHDKHPRP